MYIPELFSFNDFRMNKNNIFLFVLKLAAVVQNVTFDRYTLDTFKMNMMDIINNDITSLMTMDLSKTNYTAKVIDHMNGLRKYAQIDDNIRTRLMASNPSAWVPRTDKHTESHKSMFCLVSGSEDQSVETIKKKWLYNKFIMWICFSLKNFVKEIGNSKESHEVPAYDKTKLQQMSINTFNTYEVNYEHHEAINAGHINKLIQHTYFFPPIKRNVLSVFSDVYLYGLYNTGDFIIDPSPSPKKIHDVLFSYFYDKIIEISYKNEMLKSDLEIIKSRLTKDVVSDKKYYKVNPMEMMFQFITGFFVRDVQMNLINKISLDISPIVVSNSKPDVLPTHDVNVSAFGTYFGFKHADIIENETYGRIHNLIMGGGKTTTITPIVILRYMQYMASTNTLSENPPRVYLVAPSYLTNQSAEILLRTIGTYFPIKIKKLSEVRRPDKTKDKKPTDKFEYSKSLQENILDAHIYVMNDTSMKCGYINDHVAVLNSANKFAYLVDEVDTILNPVTSELNFPDTHTSFELHDFENLCDMIYDILTEIFIEQTKIGAMCREHETEYAKVPHFNIISQNGMLIKEILLFALREIYLKYSRDNNSRVAQNLRFTLLTEDTKLNENMTDADKKFYGEYDVKKLSENELKILYNIYNFIFEALPMALVYINRKNYGLGTPTFSDWTPLAIPFTYAEVPKDGSDFSSPILILVLTILTYKFYNKINKPPKKILSKIAREAVKIYTSNTMDNMHDVLSPLCAEIKRCLTDDLEIVQENIEEQKSQDEVIIDVEVSDNGVIRLLEIKLFMREFCKIICVDNIKLNALQKSVCGVDLMMSFNNKFKVGFTGTPNIPPFYDYETHKVEYDGPYKTYAYCQQDYLLSTIIDGEHLNTGEKTLFICIDGIFDSLNTKNVAKYSKIKLNVWNDKLKTFNVVGMTGDDVYLCICDVSEINTLWANMGTPFDNVYVVLKNSYNPSTSLDNIHIDPLPTPIYVRANPTVEVCSVDADTDKLISDAFSSAQVVTFETDDQERYLEKVLTKLNAENTKNSFGVETMRYHNTLIDIGAVLVGISINKIFEIVRKTRPNLSLFVYWAKLNGDESSTAMSKIVSMSGIVTEQKWDQSIPPSPETIFFYYDNQHITGIDAKIPLLHTGIALIGKNGRYRDVVQGIFRMRQLGKEGGHLVKFVLTTQIEDYVNTQMKQIEKVKKDESICATGGGYNAQKELVTTLISDIELYCTKAQQYVSSLGLNASNLHLYNKFTEENKSDAKYLFQNVDTLKLFDTILSHNCTVPYAKVMQKIIDEYSANNDGFIDNHSEIVGYVKQILISRDVLESELGDGLSIMNKIIQKLNDPDDPNKPLPHDKDMMQMLDKYYKRATTLPQYEDIAATTLRDYRKSTNMLPYVKLDNTYTTANINIDTTYNKKLFMDTSDIEMIYIEDDDSDESVTTHGILPNTSKFTTVSTYKALVKSLEHLDEGFNIGKKIKSYILNKIRSITFKVDERKDVLTNIITLLLESTAYTNKFIDPIITTAIGLSRLVNNTSAIGIPFKVIDKLKRKMPFVVRNINVETLIYDMAKSLDHTNTNGVRVNKVIDNKSLLGITMDYIVDLFVEYVRHKNYNKMFAGIAHDDVDNEYKSKRVIVLLTHNHTILQTLLYLMLNIPTYHEGEKDNVRTIKKINLKESVTVDILSKIFDGKLDNYFDNEIDVTFEIDSNGNIKQISQIDEPIHYAINVIPNQWLHQFKVLTKGFSDPRKSTSNVPSIGMEPVMRSGGEIVDPIVIQHKYYYLTFDDTTICTFQMQTTNKPGTFTLKIGRNINDTNDAIYGDLIYLLHTNNTMTESIDDESMFAGARHILSMYNVTLAAKNVFDNMRLSDDEDTMIQLFSDDGLINKLLTDGPTDEQLQDEKFVEKYKSVIFNLSNNSLKKLFIDKKLSEDQIQKINKIIQDYKNATKDRQIQSENQMYRIGLLKFMYDLYNFKINYEGFDFVDVIHYPIHYVTHGTSLYNEKEKLKSVGDLYTPPSNYINYLKAELECVREYVKLLNKLSYVTKKTTPVERKETLHRSELRGLLVRWFSKEEDSAMKTQGELMKLQNVRALIKCNNGSPLNVTSSGVPMYDKNLFDKRFLDSEKFITYGTFTYPTPDKLLSLYDELYNSADVTTKYHASEIIRSSKQNIKGEINDIMTNTRMDDLIAIPVLTSDGCGPIGYKSAKEIFAYTDHKDEQTCVVERITMTQQLKINQHQKENTVEGSDANECYYYNSLNDILDSSEYYAGPDPGSLTNLALSKNVDRNVSFVPYIVLVFLDHENKYVFRMITFVEGIKLLNTFYHTSETIFEDLAGNNVQWLKYICDVYGTCYFTNVQHWNFEEDEKNIIGTLLKLYFKSINNVLPMNKMDYVTIAKIYDDGKYRIVMNEIISKFIKSTNDITFDNFKFMIGQVNTELLMHYYKQFDIGRVYTLDMICNKLIIYDRGNGKLFDGITDDVKNKIIEVDTPAYGLDKELYRIVYLLDIMLNGYSSHKNISELIKDVMIGGGNKTNKTNKTNKKMRVIRLLNV
jgi:hypothetical protein